MPSATDMYFHIDALTAEAELILTQLAVIPTLGDIWRDWARQKTQPL